MASATICEPSGLISPFLLNARLARGNIGYHERDIFCDKIAGNIPTTGLLSASPFSGYYTPTGVYDAFKSKIININRTIYYIARDTERFIPFSSHRARVQATCANPCFTVYYFKRIFYVIVNSPRSNPSSHLVPREMRGGLVVELDWHDRL